MQNQDPMAPADDTAMVAQLAQFAALEQQTNQTQILTSIQQQLQSNASSQAVDLVGKQVVASFSSIQLTGTGTPAPLQFTLDSPAASVKLTIKDANGNLVRTLSGGAMAAGPESLAWDGNNSNGQPLAAGTYAVSVSALANNGGVVGARTQVSGRVSGVSYATGSPTLLLPGTQVNLGDVIQVSN
jgi:flagellar basal-body rod modification protein FlgD